MNGLSEADRVRMLAVDEVRIRSAQPARDKRRDGGRVRYLRHAGDQVVLLGMCQCPPPWRSGKPGGTCSSCQGAVLTREEKRTRPAAGPGLLG